MIEILLTEEQTKDLSEFINEQFHIFSERLKFARIYLTEDKDCEYLKKSVVMLKSIKEAVDNSMSGP